MPVMIIITNNKAGRKTSLQSSHKERKSPMIMIQVAAWVSSLSQPVAGSLPRRNVHYNMVHSPLSWRENIT